MLKITFTNNLLFKEKRTPADEKRLREVSFEDDKTGAQGIGTYITDTKTHVVVCGHPSIFGLVDEHNKSRQTKLHEQGGKSQLPPAKAGGS